MRRCAGSNEPGVALRKLIWSSAQFCLEVVVANNCCTESKLALVIADLELYIAYTLEEAAVPSLLNDWWLRVERSGWGTMTCCKPLWNFFLEGRFLLSHHTTLGAGVIWMDLIVSEKQEARSSQTELKTVFRCFLVIAILWFPVILYHCRKSLHRQALHTPNQ